MPYDFSNLQRNFQNIESEEIRKTLDEKFNLVHDELSDCYYNEKPFKTFGVLTKEMFEKLHGLIFDLRFIAFHEANLKLPLSERLPEADYNLSFDREGNITNRRSDEMAQRIQELKNQGIELVI